MRGVQRPHQRAHRSPPDIGFDHGYGDDGMFARQSDGDNGEIYDASTGQSYDPSMGPCRRENFDTDEEAAQYAEEFCDKATAARFRALADGTLKAGISKKKAKVPRSVKSSYSQSGDEDGMDKYFALMEKSSAERNRVIVETEAAAASAAEIERVARRLAEQAAHDFQVRSLELQSEANKNIAGLLAIIAGNMARSTHNSDL